MSYFIHLHVHSEFSRFDGYNTIQQLYQKANADNMASIAITDHHNVFSWFHMPEMEKAYQVNSIYGIELNVGMNHITALAMNETGLRNIWILNNLGYKKSARPNITEKQLVRYAEGIYFLSGCARGKIPNLLFQRLNRKARAAIEFYRYISKGNFALEVQNYGRNNQESIRKFINLSVDCGVEIIPTNDTHYLDKQDYVFYSNLLSIRSKGKAISLNKENYFKTTEEMELSFPAFMLEQTKKIEQKCMVNFPSFLMKQTGDREIPICKIEYYSDAEAIKKALFLRKEYKLGNYFYMKMLKENLKLEDIHPNESSFESLVLSFELRGKIRKISAHPNFYIKTNENFPIFMDSAEKKFVAQIDKEAAHKIGIPVYDSRIIRCK